MDNKENVEDALQAKPLSNSVQWKGMDEEARLQAKLIQQADPTRYS
jgi:hypothetical protein